MTTKREKLESAITNLEKQLAAKRKELNCLPKKGGLCCLTITITATPEQFAQFAEFCRNVGGDAKNTARTISDQIGEEIDHRLKEGRIPQPLSEARWTFVDHQAVYFDALYPLED